MAIERRVAGDIRISESNSDVSALPSTASSDEPSTATNDPTMRAQSILIRLYVSHTVSAWNSRMFEFGAVLFLASVLPGTLLYASIYALVRAFSAAALSSWLGAWVDQSDRLVALRHSIVLSFGGTMVTYLLHSGYRPLEISCMRLGSVAAELSGTWTAPLVMNRIGPIRSGLWFLNWQFCCVAGAAAMFFLWDSSSQLIAGMLVVGVALSRIGLWGFDLSAQFLVQENIEEHARGRFSGTEMALQNMFEMLSFASTIVFARPEQFRYPVIISAGAVTLAAACFAAYTRKERGHLLHRSKCLGGDKKGIYRRVELEESA
ncbi:hypothetical protein N7462_004511 [Penicillium macrosclerotiorum]|uniref:uncharacterized protein n=1 Tax=Penicillium macrosclerotiorum TaxID=303699 RepID=UPI002548BD9E|nr:uncharacterized protein N7462_004511 [Penicillium macrosclerotiorum]KAJ5690119.1 hypothetical protein N7462_004511 [Penicillium macrosclerotiorum]